jgi:hypothetical protein
MADVAGRVCPLAKDGDLVHARLVPNQDEAVDVFALGRTRLSTTNEERWSISSQTFHTGTIHARCVP